MKRSTLIVIVLGALLDWYGPAAAQSIEDVDRLWQLTMDALRGGQAAVADARFSEFNERARAYLRVHGRNWRVQYLVGTLDCQFAASRPTGAQLLRDLLQNTRDLNAQGRAEVKRQLDACASPQAGRTGDRVRIVDVTTAHFQSPGVQGDMKGGSRYTSPGESGAVVSPKTPDELLARRVTLDDPQRALTAALARLPPRSGGAVMAPFAVTMRRADRAGAEGVGRCLAAYLRPLHAQFGIAPPSTMVTVYTVSVPDDVYTYARTLHGLQLPPGVIAYSVPEDMSLAGMAAPGECGSMAHELVHLLIKAGFAGSPAWLEEGLASEVAVARTAGDRFTFHPSWRDDELERFNVSRPRVEELLEMPWAEFNAPPSVFNRDRQFATQAMAAVFVRYLDARGVLARVYADARDAHVAPDMSEVVTYGQIVERHLGRPLRDVDRDFDAWFTRERR